MVPRVIKVVDALPRSGNDKIDRKQLPAVDIAKELSEYIAPATDDERMLCEIFQDLLKREKVSVEADFFELGGTSLDSVKLQKSIAENFGKVIPVTTIFIYTTAREVAKLLSGSSSLFLAEVVDDSGTDEIKKTKTPLSLPALPTVNYHMEKLGLSHHLNLVKLFDIKNKKLDETIFKQAVAFLVDAHEVLTMSLSSDSQGGTVQVLGSCQPEVETVDLSHIPQEHTVAEVEQKLSLMQSEFRFEQGVPLARFVYIKTPSGEDNKLLLLFHFALIDAYGLELLVDQLTKTMKSLIAGKTPVVRSSSSYANWFEAYRKYANGAAKEELSYWLSLPWHRTAKLKLPEIKHNSDPQSYYDREDYLRLMHALAASEGCDKEKLKKLEASQTIHFFQLSNEYSQQLKARADLLGVDLIDILLAAYYSALAHYFTGNFLPIDFMFSNRRPIFKGINIANSVMRAAENIVLPLDLRADGLEAKAQQVKHIRESLPSFGLAIPALREFCDDPLIQKNIQSLPVPQVGFNYLSLWSQGDRDGTDLMDYSHENVGQNIGFDITFERSVWIQMYVDETASGLEFAITYDAHRFDHDRVESVADAFIKELTSLVSRYVTSSNTNSIQETSVV